MSVLHTICTVIQIICSVILIAVITFQSGKSEGLSAISGNAETFFSKNKADTLDAKLALATKWVAGVFIVLTFALNLLVA